MIPTAVAERLRLITEETSDYGQFVFERL